MSSEGGNAVDARRVDDGLLHVGGSVTKAGAQLRSDGVARAVHKGETGVRSAGGLVSSSAEPQRGSKELPPRNKPALLQATASPALEQTSQSSGKNSRYFHTQKGMKQTHKGMKNHCFSRKHVFHTLKRHFIPV